MVGKDAVDQRFEVIEPQDFGNVWAGGGVRSPAALLRPPAKLEDECPC